MIARSRNDREILREGGRLLGVVLAEVVTAVHPGVTLCELDVLADRRILEAGGVPAFKGYRPSFAPSPYPGTLCTSVNDEVVHGLPVRDLALRDGDIVGLDIGMCWPVRRGSRDSNAESLAPRGLYTDAAVTVPVGSVDAASRRLIAVTEQALAAGVAAARVGHRVSDIAKAVQAVVEGAGFSVVRDLVGHGVGRKAHEEPQVPNYWDPRNADVVLVDGMVLAIEPMVNAGSWRVRMRDDGWTIATADGSRSAHFEHSVLITKHGTEVLTRRE